MLTRKQVLRAVRDAPKLRKRLNELAARIEKLSQSKMAVQAQLAVAAAVTHVIDGVPLIMTRPSKTTVWIRAAQTAEGTADRVMAELHLRTDGGVAVTVRRRSGEAGVQDARLPAVFASAPKATTVAMRWVAIGDLPKGCEALIWR
jgi:hypothetical protein